jgi:hypothetical protein
MRSHCCLCVSVFPPLIVARQRLCKNVTAVTNTHTTIEELLDASFSMWPVSYQGKQAISSSQNFLLLIKPNKAWPSTFNKRSIAEYTEYVTFIYLYSIHGNGTRSEGLKNEMCEPYIIQTLNISNHHEEDKLFLEFWNRFSSRTS